MSTPLTALKGYASGILEGVAKTPEKQRHYTDMIYQASMYHGKSSYRTFSFFQTG